MSRRIKLSDQEKDWHRRRARSNARKQNFRAERKRFLIVCEGEKTEPNYFKAFRKELPQHVVELEIHGEGANTLSLVAKAQELRDARANGDYPFDQVWVVFDRDSFKAEDFDNAVLMAESSKMHSAWSNEAFELWYILHFEYRNTEMRREEYQGKLSNLFDAPYLKNAPDMHQKLLRCGNQAKAVKWAKQLWNGFITSHTPPSRSNPCTTVFRLVEELNRLNVTG